MACDGGMEQRHEAKLAYKRYQPDSSASSHVLTISGYKLDGNSKIQTGLKCKLHPQRERSTQRVHPSSSAFQGNNLSSQNKILICLRLNELYICIRYVFLVDKQLINTDKLDPHQQMSWGFFPLLEDNFNSIKLLIKLKQIEKLGYNCQTKFYNAQNPYWKQLEFEIHLTLVKFQIQT